MSKKECAKCESGSCKSISHIKAKSLKKAKSMKDPFEGEEGKKFSKKSENIKGKNVSDD